MSRKLLLLMLLTHLVGTLNFASRVEKVEASGTICIRVDGSINPPDAPISTADNVTYTLTGNIYDSIVVERDNIVVDGNGHATQGIGTGTGIELSYRSNVTLKNHVITQFDFGISLNHSANCAIVRNIMMKNNFEAIRLYESLKNNITSNDINATDYDGIVLYGSSDNEIAENNLTDNYDGIRLYESPKNDIAENIVTGNYYGIFLASSSNNSVFHNNVTTNDGNGVSLAWSSNENRIVENHIEANKWCGIHFNASSGNLIYHNSFVDNAQQTSVNDSTSLWDDGYPSGGNYWSDYTGMDSNGDGVGDTLYAIDAGNQDRYPLMYPWSPLPVHNINTGLGYAAIQEAINAPETVDGHTIFVDAGVYYENIVLGKSLAILGENAKSTVLDSHSSGSFNVIINANVTLSRFTLQNGYGGIFGNRSSMINIENNIIRNQYYYGVFVQTWGKCDVTVQDNIITACGGGIQVSYSEGFCALEGNSLLQVDSGIMIGYGMMSGKIANNTIVGNGSGTGMDLSDFYNGTLEGNYITGFSDGARFEDTSGNGVIKNVLASCTGFGLALISSDNNTVIGNEILDNGFGVWLSSSSRNNVVYQNNFISNPQQAHIESPSYSNTWDSGYPSGGDYWSDYIGTDLFSGPYQNETGSDNIGDIPYYIDANNQDNYPLMGPHVPFENQTVYIRADGSVDPSGAPILRKGDLYTLSGNITSNADGIIIERDNMILEGAGYTVQGTGVAFSRGIDISGRSNLTIKNMKTEVFFWGVYISSSSNDTFSGNNITNNDRGIYLEYSSNNSVARNNITNNWYGIYLYQSSNNSINGNNITNNGWLGIYLWFSSSNSIRGDSITNNFDGIDLDGSSSNSISGDSITNNANGIVLDSSSNHNTISENSITNNSDIGIELWNSSNNKFFHNNFINNTQQVHFATFGYSNSWDDYYPSGGNYWGDYDGTDLNAGPYQNQTGSDGVGDTLYVIDGSNVDVYPLMAPYGTFDAGTWNEKAYSVDVVSNSTVSGFHFDPTEGPFLKFNVTGQGGTVCFCRVTIPKDLLWAEDGDWVVLVGGAPITDYTMASDQRYTYLCFTYGHSTNTVQISGTKVVIPEFSSFLILPLFFTATLLVVIVYRKKHARISWTP